MLFLAHRPLLSGWLVMMMSLCTLSCGDDSTSASGDGEIDLDAATDRDAFTDAGDVDVDVDVDADAPVSCEELGPPTEGQLVDRLDIVENPANVLSFFVEYRTPARVVTDVTVTCGDEIEQTYVSEVDSVEHEVFVMGLLAETPCTFVIRSQTTAGCEGEVARELTVSPLPSWLGPITLNAADTERMQPGWTLFNNYFTEGPLDAQLSIVDELGRYRWYHLRRGRANHVSLVDGGVLAGAFECCRSAIVNWDGSDRWNASFLTHHDVRESPFNDDHLLFLGQTRDCPENTSEDTVNEVDLATNDVIWTWNPCDHYTPANVRPDWTHLNTIEPVPGERAMLVCSRDQHLIWKVDRDSGEIIWTLGRNRDFEMAPEDYFFGPHAPELHPDGNILLFDNGRGSARGYSRAIELELTFTEEGEPDTAAVVWEYVDEAIFAPVRGDADRLANGNTLITFGGDRDTGTSILREVTAEGDIVWDLVTDPLWGVYRSDRIDPTYGFVREGGP